MSLINNLAASQIEIQLNTHERLKIKLLSKDQTDDKNIQGGLYYNILDHHLLQNTLLPIYTVAVNKFELPYILQHFNKSKSKSIFNTIISLFSPNVILHWLLFHDKTPSWILDELSQKKQKFIKAPSEMAEYLFMTDYMQLYEILGELLLFEDLDGLKESFAIGDGLWNNLTHQFVRWFFTNDHLLQLN